MELRGICKLRLFVTFLFVAMIVYIFLIMSSADIDIDAEGEFFESLSSDEIDTLEDIYSDFPDTGTTDNYELAGYIGYIVTGALFILMYKVWTIEIID